MPASGAMDSCLILSLIKPMTWKLVFTASLLDAQQLKDRVENKPASLLVPLGKTLYEMSPVLEWHTDGWQLVLSAVRLNDAALPRCNNLMHRTSML